MENFKPANDVVRFELYETATQKQEGRRGQSRRKVEQMITAFSVRDGGGLAGAGRRTINSTGRPAWRGGNGGQVGVQETESGGCRPDFQHQSRALTQLSTNSATTERPFITSWQLFFW